MSQNKFSLFKGYQGNNVFRDNQARDYPERQFLVEFHPTPQYYSLFNSTNEILVGSRGCGKTILLRMLSYSLFSQIATYKAQYRAGKRYTLGVYVPLRLAIVKKTYHPDFSPDQLTEYFGFCTNCIVLISYIHELDSYLNDTVEDHFSRAKIERSISEGCSALLNFSSPISGQKCVTFNELLLSVEKHFQEKKIWINGQLDEKTSLANLPLLPLLEFAKFATKEVGLDIGQTTWMICLDEAEYLPTAFIRVFNTVIRSEKRPFSIKIATLPYHYTTFETLVAGENVMPGGNDFDFVNLDQPPESPAFKELTNQIIIRRLSRTFEPKMVPHLLEDVIETAGDGDLTSIYRQVIGKDAVTTQDLTDLTLSHLSEKRRRALSIRSDLGKDGSIKRYRPIAILRELRRLESRGANVSCALSGAKTIRLLSDGNPRLFLQLMAALLEAGRDQILTLKVQHKTLTDFCRRRIEFIPAISTQGFVLDAILRKVASAISERVHGSYAVDYGRTFRLSEHLLEKRGVQTAIVDGVASGFLSCEILSDRGKFNADTIFRLAYTVAAYFWIPLRDGQPVRFSSRELQLDFLEAVTVPQIESLQLNLELHEEEEI
jgi:hypothetical protein